MSVLSVPHEMMLFPRITTDQQEAEALIAPKDALTHVQI